MMRRRVISKGLIVSLVAGLSLSGIAQAAAPVVDLSSQQSTQQTSSSNSTSSVTTSAPVDTSGMSTDQRLSRLENIAAAQNTVGMFNQLNTLQQQVQQLQGQVDDANHQMQQLQSQMKQQYADFDQRLAKIEAAIAAAPKGSAISVPAAPVTGAIVDEQQAYQQAYNFIKSQNYPKAADALNAYIKQYPQGKYVSNAYYWLGEVSLAQGDVPGAVKQFKTVVTSYQNSDKVPDALLKLGTINAELGDKATAKQQLNTIITKYPNSPTAKLAKAQLAQIK